MSDCFDEPLQIAAYGAALGLNKGALVKLYKDREADVIYIDEEQMEFYWNQFSKRYISYVNQYNNRE